MGKIKDNAEYVTHIKVRVVYKMFQGYVCVHVSHMCTGRLYKMYFLLGGHSHKSLKATTKSRAKA